MTTFKAEVYAHQKKQDGTYNIKIRVIHRGKKRYLPTPFFVTQKDLTRSLKIKNQKYIDLTDDIIRGYRHKCDMISHAVRQMDIDRLVEIITGDGDKPFDLNIVDYTRNYINHLKKTGHKGNASTYETMINNLVKFAGMEQISIFDITSGFLSDWVQWMDGQKTMTSGHSKHNYPSRLRAIHNRAKMEFNDDDAGIIRIPNNPFVRFKIPPLPPVRKRAITLDQLKKLIDLPYRASYSPFNDRFNLAKDLFILSFALIGINEVDLYTCMNCEDGRITYERTKTKNRRSDRAEISIKIAPEIAELVKKYQDPKGERVFRFYKDYSSVDAFTAAVNHGLKIIGKMVGVDDLEFYAARHTWATLAVNDAGVDKYIVHQALNHVDDEMRVTDIYIKKSWANVDAANRKVLDLVNIGDLDVAEPKYVRKYSKNTWSKK